MVGIVVAFVVGAVCGGVAMFIYYKKAKKAFDKTLADATAKYEELKAKVN